MAAAFLSIEMCMGGFSGSVGVELLKDLNHNGHSEFAAAYLNKSRSLGLTNSMALPSP
jgi:hypothetical protein